MNFKIIGIHNTYTRNYIKDIKIIRRNSKGFQRMKNEKNNKFIFIFIILSLGIYSTSVLLLHFTNSLF